MGFTAQLEDQIWLKSGSWKGYCRRLARKAASLGHAGCLRVLRELGGEAAASLAAADAAHGHRRVAGLRERAESHSQQSSTSKQQHRTQPSPAITFIHDRFLTSRHSDRTGTRE